MSQIFPNPEPEKAVLADMTRIVMRWSHIESAVNIGICTILNIPDNEREALIGPIRAFRAREQIFRNLLEIKAREAKNDPEFVDKLFAEITKCYDIRNKIVHGHWLAYNDYERITQVLKTKDKNTKEFIPVIEDLSFQEIQDGAGLCFALMMKLGFILHNLRDEHPPFGDKYPGPDYKESPHRSSPDKP